MELTYDFVLGAITMGTAVAGLCFLRFWRQTQDRLFLAFALAFWVFALGRLLLVLLGDQTESRTVAYVLRLCGFLLIILAILDKNRSRRAP